MILFRIAFKNQVSFFKNSCNFVCLSFYVYTVSFFTNGIVSTVAKGVLPS